MPYLLLCLALLSNCLHADTINNYMNITNNIPQMEMKADPQAQAWARSAHHVIIITCESIAETMLQANETATNQGKPAFCLPLGVTLNPALLDGIIQQTYRDLSSQQSDKDKMTVSQVAWLGISKKYPCEHNTAMNAGLAHMESELGR
ncbi:MAG: phosphatase [Legionellales bacterium]